MADLARAEAREERGGKRKRRCREERRAKRGKSEEQGARRGSREEQRRRSEARKESRGKGGARKNARERSEEQRGEKGATRSDLDSQNTCFYERDPCKTLVWLRFPFENAAKPWFWRPRGVKSTCFTSPKCLPGRSLSLLGTPGGPLGGPVGQTGPSGGTQGLQTRFLEAYMCVLYGPADVFKHVGT